MSEAAVDGGMTDAERLEGWVIENRVMERAAELTASGWCAGALARDADGNNVDPNSPKAVAWCAEGALKKAVCEISNERFPLMDLRVMARFKNNINPYPRREGVMTYNDAADGKHIAACFRFLAKSTEAAVEHLRKETAA